MGTKKLIENIIEEQSIRSSYGVIVEKTIEYGIGQILMQL